jgi:hypothetical protein
MAESLVGAPFDLRLMMAKAKDDDYAPDEPIPDPAPVEAPPAGPAPSAVERHQIGKGDLHDRIAALEQWVLDHAARLTALEPSPAPAKAPAEKKK